MNYSVLLMGILPLLFFVIVDSFLGLKAGLFVAIAFAVAEAIYTYIVFGEIDSVTIFTLLTVFIFAWISFKKKSPIFIKMQPVIMSFILATVLITSFLMGKPLLYELMMKYKDQIIKAMPLFENNFGNPMYIVQLKISTCTLGVFLYLHAIVTAIAAFKMSNWWWIAIRGIGFYVFLFLSTIASALVIKMGGQELIMKFI
ncbi:MAG: septation protein IspZ [Halobacteriovoraceae bacterium]|nr:septation protein IspZ [Halobacteriovoraceae bacterium]